LPPQPKKLVKLLTDGTLTDGTLTDGTLTLPGCELLLELLLEFLPPLLKEKDDELLKEDEEPVLAPDAFGAGAWL